ncbi:MAG TPA: efflux RND transporter periplasmic adaptor subunit [Thermoanaerobaculia bacterium]
MSSHSANAVLLTFLVAACSGNETATERQSVQAPVVVARRTSLPAFHSVAGTVRSQTSSTLAANLVGTVVRVAVAEGDRVRAGDVLVEIDAREPRAQAERASAARDESERAIEGAAANAQLAETTYRRFEALRQRGSASQQELDEARARRTSAQAELARLTASRQGARAAVTQAAAVLDHSSVRAPMNGLVTARFVDPGAQAAPGIPLIAIEEERATRVDATVAEGISVVAGARAVVEAGDQRLDARVVRVQPSVDSAARSALVKLELARPLRAGTYVKVSFPIGERSAVVIPAASVVRHGQLTSVFVIGKDDVARMRLITIGATGGADVEVLSGLDAGETIASAPAGVRDGVIVRSGA